MNTRMLIPTLRLFLLFLFSFCTICSLPAQEQSLRDPKAITIKDISLNDFLKLHKQGLMEAIPSSQVEIDSEVVSIQVDYFLKQEGYSIDFLKEVDLSNTDLSRADLRFLNLKEANLKGSDLTKADLSFVNLKEADLTGAVLVKADLTQSNIKEAIVKDADFSDAVLEGTDIHEAEGLTVNQLLSAKSLINAKLPPAFKKELIAANPKLFKIP